MEGKPFIIGISGGAASGKTTVTEAIKTFLGNKCTLVSMDNFYFDLSPIDQILAETQDFDFDDPQAMDLDSIYELLLELSLNQIAKSPIYDFKTNSKTGEYFDIRPSPVIIIEGIHALYSSKIRQLLNLKIFIDTPENIRFMRKLKRDTT